MKKLKLALLVLNVTAMMAIAESRNSQSSSATNNGAASHASVDVFATAPKFENGDRVCFIGDSITDIGFYYSYLRLFYDTRFPERGIEYLPAGHSGGNAADCCTRLNWDILARSPNIATVNFGMNDLSGTYGTPKDSTEQVDNRILERIQKVQVSYEKLLDALTAAGVRLVLVGPSIYDDTVQLDDVPVERSNRALVLWTLRLKGIAVRRHLGFVDLCSKMNEVNSRLQADDPKATIVGKDRVHPREPGNFVMLYSILKSQGIGPFVSRISLDANAQVIASNQINCMVEGMEKLSNGISFICLEKALPYPMPYGTEKALSWVPFTEEFNCEILVVKGMPAGTYELRIDGTIVGEYEASGLAEGINLALNSKTPQYQQSQQILQYNRQWHGLEVKLRYLPFLRHCRESRQDIKWDDRLAVDKFLREEVERLKFEGFFCRIAKLYIEEVSGKADAIKSQAETLEKKIESDRAPKPHKFSLLRLNRPLELK